MDKQIKERGIIFNDEMVRAVLDGRKTQTRRVMKLQPESNQHGMCVVTESGIRSEEGKFFWSEFNATGHKSRSPLFSCPFGKVGDRLWVREAWARYNIEQNSHDMAYRATMPDDWPKEGSWRPSIHMPRWASRITLEITDVRVERLNGISEQDAAAEGVGSSVWFAAKGVPEDEWTSLGEFGAQKPSHINRFASLWESIYGQDSWHSNPWVWVISFRRVEEACLS